MLHIQNLKGQKEKKNNQKLIVCVLSKDDHSFPHTCFGIYSLSKVTTRQR